MAAPWMLNRQGFALFVKLFLKYSTSQHEFVIFKTDLKRGSQHPSNKFEILWQVTQNSFSLLLSYFAAQYVLIIVVFIFFFFEDIF